MSINNDLPVQLSELEEGQRITNENGEITLSDPYLEQLMKKKEWKKSSGVLKKTFLYFYFHPDETERSSFRDLFSKPKELEEFVKHESVHYDHYFENKKYETNIMAPVSFIFLLCSCSGGIYGAIAGVSGCGIYGIIAGLSLLGVGLIIASPFIYRKFCAKKFILEREKVLKELNIPNIEYVDEC